MSIFQSAFLGIVQGITEFLPISSSGHLVLFQKIFGIASNAISFDVFLHLGTLVAVFIVFRKDIWTIIKNPLGKLPVFLAIGTVPAIVIGLLFKDVFAKLFASGATIGAEFILTGIVLVYAERLSCRAPSTACVPKTLPAMTAIDATAIGFAQAIAIFPAVSRSGLTIASALYRKLDREFALKFSFLLSAPAIIGSVALDGIDVIRNPESIFILPTVIGTLAAAISGYFAIRYMLKVFSKKSLTPFALYVFALGGLIVIDQMVTHIFF